MVQPDLESSVEQCSPARWPPSTAHSPRFCAAGGGQTTASSHSWYQRPSWALPGVAWLGLRCFHFDQVSKNKAECGAKCWVEIGAGAGLTNCDWDSGGSGEKEKTAFNGSLASAAPLVKAFLALPCFFGVHNEHGPICMLHFVQSLARQRYINQSRQNVFFGKDGSKLIQLSVRNWGRCRYYIVTDYVHLSLTKFNLKTCVHDGSGSDSSHCGRGMIECIQVIWFTRANGREIVVWRLSSLNSWSSHQMWTQLTNQFITK